MHRNLVLLASSIVIAVVVASTLIHAAESYPFVANFTAATSYQPDFLQTTQDIAVLVNWDHANYSSPRLQKMAQQLNFKLMRVGGTEMDYTWYDGFGSSSSSSSAANSNNNRCQRPGPSPAPFLKTLTPCMFDMIVEFARTIGVKIYFGINLGYGPGVRESPRGSWLPDMASTLIKYAEEKHPGRIIAYEMSNEPNLFFFRMNSSMVLSGAEFARDAPTFRSLVKGINSNLTVVGLDVAYVPLFGEIGTFMSDFTKAGGMQFLDKATFHFYPLLAKSYEKFIPPQLDPFNATPSKITEGWILSQVTFFAEQFNKDNGNNNNNNKNNVKVPVILGETGSAVGGGGDNVSNVFADSLEFVDKIGQMRRIGVERMFRQTLVGSPDQFYALISHSLEAHPSYFVAAAVTRLMGAGTFSVSLLDSSNDAAFPYLAKVRAYAACSKRNTATALLYAVNIDKDKALPLNVTLLSPSNPSNKMGVKPVANSWQFTAGAVGLTSKQIWLNGALMTIDTTFEIQPSILNSAKLLPLGPDATAGTIGLVLPPLSITFIELSPIGGNDANALSAICGVA